MGGGAPKIGIQHLFAEHLLCLPLDFPCSSVSKESACNAGDQGLDPGLGRSYGEGNGNPLQYSCLGKPKDRGAWWDTAELFQILKDDGVKVLHSICQQIWKTKQWKT